MKQTEFSKMKEIEKEEEMNELELGDFFLYGRHVIAQKQSKAPGQEISYYQVVGKCGASGIEYAPIFDILEND